MNTPELIAAFRSETEDLVKAVLLQYYFNNGAVPYANTAEVLSVIPIGLRAAYLTVNVAGVEYWFLPDGSLVPKFGSLTLANGSVTMAKIMDIASQTFIGRNAAGPGSPEVLSVATVLEMLGLTSYANKVDKEVGKSLVNNGLILKIHDKFAEDEAAVIAAIQAFLDGLVLTDNNYTDEEKAKLALLHQDIYTISLPAGNIATKVAGATFTPTGWGTVAQSGDYDVIITHVLTGRKARFVNIFEINGSDEDLLSFDKGTAYTGITNSGLTTKIKGLAPTTLAININLIFD